MSHSCTATDTTLLPVCSSKPSQATAPQCINFQEISDYRYLGRRTVGNLCIKARPDYDTAEMLLAVACMLDIPPKAMHDPHVILWGFRLPGHQCASSNCGREAVRLKCDARG